MNVDQFRVTSIPFTSSLLVIFSGVPLKKNSSKQHSGKYYVTIKADPEFIPVQPAIGQHWDVKGERVVEDVEIGDYIMQQYTYSSPEYVQCSLPDTGEQLIRFIASEKAFKGIGESKARALWELLGKDFHSTLSVDTPEARKRLREVLSEESIEALFAGYAKYTILGHTNWMSSRKIPASVQQRLLRHHGEKSIEAIKENPFLLVGFGMSFKDIDSILPAWELTQAIERSDDRRLSAALELAIRKEIEKGHTYTDQKNLRAQLIKLLKDKKLVDQAFSAGHDQVQFIRNPDTGAFHPTAQYLMEIVVAKRLLGLASQKDLFDSEADKALKIAISELPYDLTGKQLEAVSNCLDNAVSCITGGAGTGKTTVLRTALRAYSRVGFTIHAVALSGRAAMRLHESIGFITMTIAALLRSDPVEPDLAQPLNLLVIDEASMIDLPTMYRLVTHLDPSVRIIFSGDPYQLPPIGCGKVLSDIVKSESITNTTLDIVKRQEGSTGIPEYSKSVKEGHVPEKLSTGGIHFHHVGKEGIARLCCELYQTSSLEGRVMAPTKALVREINDLIQKDVNPSGQRLLFTMNGEQFYLDLRLGDAILFTKNQYDKGIQNGSLGVMTSVNGHGDKYGEVTLDTGETVEINQAVLDCMELGYAITLHKAQGSQFPRIIIALQKGRIVDRAWLYTAITRAESEVHIVGGEEDFRAIIESPGSADYRNSFLEDLLRRGGSQG